MYDRNLIDYLPMFLQDVRELKAIMNNAEQPEMLIDWTALENALDDQFINDSTEYGVSRWEQILGITPKATLTLDERKFAILTRINESLPFTETTLNDFLITLCGKDGYKCEIHSNDYTIVIKLALGNKNNFQDVVRYLDKIKPANMITTVSLLYNTHEVLSGFTHAQLAAYTHKQLWDEVIK